MCGKKTFGTSGKPNPWSAYDAGQAAAMLSVQAMHEGVYVHQMAGFDKEKARTIPGVVEDLEPLAVIALGYYADPAMLSPEILARESAIRTRKPLDSLVL